jgi:hypothetical protein
MNDKTLNWISQNKPTHSSKLKKYQDDILYLKKQGYSFRQIKACLIEEYRLSISAQMICYFYNKHLKDKDAPIVEELAIISSEQKQTAQKEDVETKTKEKKADSEGGSSSKYKEKKDFDIAEFLRTDPMFKKFNKKEGDST